MSRAHRIALVGAGWWSTAHHLPALLRHPRAEVVAIVDPRHEHAAQVAHHAGIPAVFGSTEELIESGLAEAAVVATPHSTHHPLVRALLEAGMPVLVDKPLATSAADAVDLAELARERGLLLAVGYTAQYAPAAAAARQWVSEELGQLVQVIIEFSSRAGRLFAAAAPDDASSAYSAATGGGQANTQLTHAAAMMLWTTGQQVSELAALTAGRGLAVDIEDAVVFRLGTTAIGTAAATGALGAGRPLRQRVRYVGTDGTVEHDLIAGTAELLRESGRSSSLGADHLAAAYPAEAPAREFVDLLGDDGENHGDPVSAVRAVAFTEAVHESSATGAFVPVAQYDPAPDGPGWEREPR